MSDNALATRKLANEEREKIYTLFMLGPSGLMEAGMGPNDIVAFMSDPVVGAEIKALSEEFRDQKALNHRRVFMAKRKLALHVPQAIRIIESAMRGPEYMTDPDGKTMVGMSGKFLVRTPSPTPQQLAAAQDVLDRLNVTGATGKELSSFASLMVKLNYGLDKQEGLQLQYKDDLSEENKRRSRDRMRRVMDAVAPELTRLIPKIHTRMSELLTQRDHSNRHNARKKERAVVTGQVVQKKKKKNRE